MTDWEIVESQDKQRTASSSSTFGFKIKTDAICAVMVKAKASAWWQNWPQFLRRFFKDDNLAIKLDNYPRELTYNGNDLKGLEQVNIFLVKLKAEAHTLAFKANQTPVITGIKIYEAKIGSPDLVEILPTEIQDGNRRPLYKLAVIDLNPTKMLVKAQVKTGRSHRLFQNDDDDLQVAIDNKIVENQLPKAHKNWFWCGRAQTYQNTSTRVLVQNISPGSFVTIDFYADGTPKIEELRVFFKDSNIRPTFDKFLIIDDSEFTNLVLSRDQIDDFLRDNVHGQPEHIALRAFEGKSTAEIIYQACNVNSINPKVILAKLQAEQGLVEGPGAANPTKQQLDGAMGVGIFDDGTVDKRYQGFSKQIISAAETLRENFNKAEGKKFEVKVDGENIVVKNRASYSLYRYTPHFAGVELFFDIYQNFFNR